MAFPGQVDFHLEGSKGGRRWQWIGNLCSFSMVGKKGVRSASPSWLKKENYFLKNKTRKGELWTLKSTSDSLTHHTDAGRIRYSWSVNPGLSGVLPLTSHPDHTIWSLNLTIFLHKMRMAGPVLGVQRLLALNPLKPSLNEFLKKFPVKAHLLIIYL